MPVTEERQVEQRAVLSSDRGEQPAVAVADAHVGLEIDALARRGGVS
jgi:hypothetical protein